MSAGVASDASPDSSFWLTGGGRDDTSLDEGNYLGYKAYQENPNVLTRPMSTVEAPTMPDFARFIPQTVMTDMRNQETADQWAKGAQENLANTWASLQYQNRDSMVQGAIDGALAPNIGMDVQPVLSVSDTDPGAITQAADTAVQPPAPSMQDMGAQFWQGIQKAMSEGAKGAGLSPVAPEQAPASLGEAAVNAAQAEASREKPLITPAGVSVYNPNTPTPFGEGEAAPAARMAAEGEGVSGKVLQAAGRAAEGGGEGVIAREALTADHPIVQAVVDAAEQAGGKKVSPDAVAKLLQSPGFNPENLAKSSGRIGPVQSAAVAAWKVAQDPEMAAAVMESRVPRLTDAELEDALRAAAGMTADQEWESIPGLAGRGDISNFTGEVAPLEASAPAGKTVEPVSTEPPYTGAGYSMLADNPVVKGLNAVQGVLKQAVIGGSIFHPLVESAQLGRTALAEATPISGAKGIAAANRAFVDSGFAQRFAAENADVISRAEQAGATMVRIGGDLSPDVQQVGNRLARTLLSSTGSGIAGYASAKAQGQSDEDALKRGVVFAAGGAGIAQLAPALNAALWGRMVPVAKVEAFKMLEPAYGADVAAKRINDIFGGQNLAKLGRNPEVQTIVRSTFLAPDWLESWARNAGAVVKPGPEGNAARKWWAATGISAALGLEGLNMAINGHATTENEPGRQLQLEITPLLKAMGQNPQQRVYADVLELGPLGSVMNAAERGGVGAVGSNLATGHLNVLPDIALKAVQNQAPTGGQIVAEKTPAGSAVIPEIAAAAAHAAPIGVSTFEKGDLPAAAQAGSAATGIRLYEGPAVKPSTKAVNPAAPASGVKGANLANTRSFLTGKTPKATNPAAPASNLQATRSLLR